VNRNSLSFSWSNVGWHIVKDYSALFILLLLSFYVVYFTKPVVSQLFFLLLLVSFFFLKKDYFWFAFFFILIQGPGYFFADFSGASLYRLPLYTIFSDFSFTVLDIFVILAVVKAFMRGRKIQLQLGKPLIIVSLYMLVIICVTSIIFGTTIEDLAWNFRWIFYYSIIISFSYLVYKKHEIYQFVHLIFPMVFFILFTQIYFVATGNEFINIFNPGFRGVTLNTVTGEIRPLMGGVLIIFLSYIFSIFFLVDKSYKLSKFYLYIVISASFMSVFLSAARLWFVIFSFIFAGYMVITKKKILSTIGIAAVVFLVLSTLMYVGIIPPELLVQSSWGRLQQVFFVASGNVYSVDTAMNRLVNQLPILVGLIKENPLIGYGLSHVSMTYYDNDFGFLNTILMFGFIGLLFFVFFFAKMFLLLLRTIKKIRMSNSYKIPLKVMVLTWIGILIGYFSTWDFFTMYFDKVFFVSLLIVFAEFFVWQAYKQELRYASDRKEV
jgi:hypothetical protein